MDDRSAANPAARDGSSGVGPGCPDASPVWLGRLTVQLQVDGEGAYHGLVRRCMVRKIVVMGTKGLCLFWWVGTSLV